MRSIPLMSLLLILAVSASACGGDDGGDVPLDQLANKIAAASCKNIFKCCDAAERMEQFQIFNPAPTTEAECTTTLAAFYQSFVVGNESVTSGRMGYDGGAAADCIAAVNAAACGAATQEAQDEGACDEFFFGTIAAGGMCKNDDECAVDNSFCDGGSSDTFGACTALPTVGQACDFQCADGAFCDFGSSMCMAQKANGMPCGDDDECVSDTCDTTCMAETADMTCDGA